MFEKKKKSIKTSVNVFIWVYAFIWVYKFHPYKLLNYILHVDYQHIR